MSTPVGHSIAGYIALAAADGNTRRRISLSAAAAVVVFSNLPDIDFLFGYAAGSPNRFHHQWTHSVGFAVMAALIAVSIWRIVKKQWNLRLGFLTFMLVVSHLVIDLFTIDRSAPYGLQLLWPISDHYYIGRPAIFMDVMKASTQKAFIPSLFSYHNLKTVIWECVLLIPAGLMVRRIGKKCNGTTILRRSK
ncbi:metal-dependent hydrolase [bacterium]|nr:metal-dependent hydrolase [bacterium]